PAAAARRARREHEKSCAWPVGPGLASSSQTMPPTCLRAICADPPIASGQMLVASSVNRFLSIPSYQAASQRLGSGRRRPGNGSSRRSVSTPSADDRLPLLVVLLIWLATAATVAVSYWQRLDDSFLSPDNAMRLVEVRALLDGAPWFDPHEPRVAPPFGYD